MEIHRSQSDILLNASHTSSHSSPLDSSIHPIPVNNSSKEEIEYRFSHNEYNPQETHPHSTSHSSDVTFVSQLSYVPLFHYNFLSFLSLEPVDCSISSIY